MSIERCGARIQALRQRSHGQRIGPVVVDDLQGSRDDPVQRNRRAPG
jgi:hypothetical protein